MIIDAVPPNDAAVRATAYRCTIHRCTPALEYGADREPSNPMGSHAVASGSKPGIQSCRRQQRGLIDHDVQPPSFCRFDPVALGRDQGSGGASGAADSAEWPARPVRFIVPAAAGSAGDDVCRLIAAKLGERFGQPFAIVNQPAAVGTLAMQDLARATPDGYTIGQISASTQVIAKLYTPEFVIRRHQGFRADFPSRHLALRDRGLSRPCRPRPSPNWWPWPRQNRNH